MPLLIGFRENDSNQHRVLNMIQDCKKKFDKDENVGVLFIDLSKAFAEAAARRCSVKLLFKILPNSQKNTCAGDTFLRKLKKRL